MKEHILLLLMMTMMMNQSYKITILTISLIIQKDQFFAIVGTGGAHDMTLSSLDDYRSSKGIEGKFGILDIELEGDQKPLKASFY